MRRSSLFSALVLSLLAAAPALAQPPRDRPGGPPERDGPPPGRDLFISPAGEPFRGPDGLKAWFEGADADHDGALTLAEFRADALRFFKVLDTNHDGVIDGMETRVYETRIAPEIIGQSEREDEGPRGPPRGGPPGGMDGPPGDSFRARSGGPRGLSRREGAARFGLLNEPQPVRGADADLDWRVTAEEWARAAAKRFDLLDPAHAGRLTLADLPPTGGVRRPPDPRPRKRPF